MGHVRISIEDSLHKNLKRRAIDEGIPMRELVVKALEDYVKRNPPLPALVRENKPARAQAKASRRRSSA